MSKRNLLANSKDPIGPTDAEDIAGYTKTIRTVKRTRPDGSEDKYTLYKKLSRPDNEGGYIETLEERVLLDNNDEPIEDPANFVLSHTGLAISKDEDKGICRSIFHSMNKTRLFKINHDGVTTKAGQCVCSQCKQVQIYISVVGGIFGLSLLIGLYKGIGVF